MIADADLLGDFRNPGWRAVNHPQMFKKFAVVRGYPGEGIEFVRDERGEITAFSTPFIATKHAERLNPMTPRSAAQVRAAFRGFLADRPKPKDDLFQQLNDLELVLSDRADALHPDKTPVALPAEAEVEAPLMSFGDLLLVVYAFNRNPAYSAAQKASLLITLADLALGEATKISGADATAESS